MAARPTYEVLAARCATHESRLARENFLHPEEPDAVMPIDYYVWLLRGASGVIVVDTGMSPTAPARRPGRRLVMPVQEALARSRIDPGEVADVVLTHLHYDHAGGLELFPRARFHVQDAELAYATGRAMGSEPARRAFDVDDTVAVVRRVYAGRMVFHDGTVEIAPGITLHLIGGHTDGLQVVRVPTERGWIVLASDATHLWANIRKRSPFPIVADLLRMMEGYRIVEALADGPDHVIPGHDPLVRTRFPSVPGQSEIVRVDLPATSA